jgi:hypothetical protein
MVVFLIFGAETMLCPSSAAKSQDHRVHKNINKRDRASCITITCIHNVSPSQVRDRAGQRNIPIMSRDSDAHTRRPDRGCRHAVSHDQALCPWRECPKANRGRTRPEDRVDVRRCPLLGPVNTKVAVRRWQAEVGTRAPEDKTPLGIVQGRLPDLPDPYAQGSTVFEANFRWSEGPCSRV